MSGSRKKGKRLISRSLALKGGAVFLFILLIWSWAALWFVHHPRAWLEAHCASWPRLVTAPLLWMGEPLGDVTDAVGLTGEDAVQTTDRPAPSDSVLFAGLPVRRSSPAPKDIVVLDKGRILEMGTPEELMAAKGKYYKLIQIQTMAEKAQASREEEGFAE